jgi:hypothetical protein
VDFLFATAAARRPSSQQRGSTDVSRFCCVLIRAQKGIYQYPLGVWLTATTAGFLVSPLLFPFSLLPNINTLEVSLCDLMWLAAALQACRGPA